VMDKEDQIINFLSSLEGVVAWVIQRYIENPLLLEGERKFDIRCWVILDSCYNAWIYKEGVLRTTSTSFNLDDLSDAFTHLSNHCIQSKHPLYGSYECKCKGVHHLNLCLHQVLISDVLALFFTATNEMWFHEFDSWLVSTKGY
jgi:hypothetical protein